MINAFDDYERKTMEVTLRRILCQSSATRKEKSWLSFWSCKSALLYDFLRVHLYLYLTTTNRCHETGAIFASLEIVRISYFHAEFLEGPKSSNHDDLLSLKLLNGMCYSPTFFIIFWGGGIFQNSVLSSCLCYLSYTHKTQHSPLDSRDLTPIIFIFYISTGTQLHN